MLFGGLELQGQPDGSSARNILKFNSLKRERYQEMLYLKEDSSLQPLRQGRILTSNLQQTGEPLESKRGASFERSGSG